MENPLSAAHGAALIMVHQKKLAGLVALTVVTCLIQSGIIGMRKHEVRIRDKWLTTKINPFNNQ